MMNIQEKITEADLSFEEDSYYDSDEEEKSQNENSENENISNEHPLSDVWTIWYHKLYDKDWSINGYKKIYSFSTIENFWRMFNTLIKSGDTEETKIPIILRGDFFIMKNEILPMWEDPLNLEGCSDSYLTKDRND